MGDLVLTDGEVKEISHALQRAGFTRDDIHRLCESNLLVEVRSVLLGHASINVVEHVIDCDAQPFVPDDWSVEEHQKGGAFKWDKETQKGALYLSKGQAGSKSIEGKKLRKELSDKSTPVLNANVLDYLLANPDLIPEEWKGKFVFLWGTVYRSRGGGLCVRYLYWSDGSWRWSGDWLDGAWRGRDPALLRAS